MTKKVIPDPPFSTKTATTFGSCDDSHPPLFSVRVGVSAEDALVHASNLLKSAFQTIVLACERADEDVRSLLWQTEHSVETCLALVESLLDDVESRNQPPSSTRPEPFV